MGIMSGLFSPSKSAGFGPTMTTSNSDGWFFRAVAPETNSGVAVSEYTALQLPVVYAAVGIVSDALAQLPLEVFQHANGRTEKRPEHPVARLMSYQPNEYMTPFTYRNTVQHHAMMWGNGYSEIQRNMAGEVVGLWPLLPDRTKPYREDGRIEYRTSVDGDYFPLDPEKVLHIPAMGFDGLIGYSPIWLCRQAVGMALAMEEFGGKFFRNDMKSGGFIMHPGKLGDKARKNLADSTQNQGGLDNAHRVKILEEGAKFVQTTIPPEDAQFLGSREFQIAEIARIYRVPLHMLQSHEKSTAWGSGLEQMTLGFLQYTLEPWLVRWEQEMNRKLFTERERSQGYYVKHNVAELLRGDAGARSQFYERALNPDTGWMLRNEVREREDMNPLDDNEWQRENTEEVIE